MIGTLPIRWVLGQSLEESGRTELAIAAYEDVLSPLGLSRRGDFDSRPAYVSMAYRKLALLYAASGQSGKAQEHLAAFEAMFTDPSPELEWILEEVRSAVNGMN
jgi:hypothetical protein